MPDRLDPTLDELSQQNGVSQGLPPSSPTPDWYARMVEQQQRWGMPPASQQIPDIIGKTGQTLGKMATALPRAAKEATEYSLNPPADFNLEEAIRKAAGATMMLPSSGGAMEAGIMAAIKDAGLKRAGTDIGMFKLVPQKHSTGGDYHILDHNDEVLGDLNNVSMGRDGILNVYGMYSTRESPYPQGHPAREANRATHGFTRDEIYKIGHAIMDEFPEAKAATGFRVSGARSKRGPASQALSEPMASEYQTMPLKRRGLNRGPNEVDLPPMPEFEKSLGDLAKQNIADKAKQARPTEHATPRMPPGRTWVDELQERSAQERSVPPVPSHQDTIDAIQRILEQWNRENPP